MTIDRAVSIRQPWAEVILRGRKRHEYRTWGLPAKHEGVSLALHAPALVDRAAYATQCLLHEDLPVSAVVGVVAFGIPQRVRLTSRDLRAPYADDPGCPPVSPDPWASIWAWPILRVARCVPIPCRGRLGIWTLPGDVCDLLATRELEEVTVDAGIRPTT